MSETVTNELLLEHLKAIQSRLGAMAGDISDLKSDMLDLKTLFGAAPAGKPGL